MGFESYLMTKVAYTKMSPTTVAPIARHPAAVQTAASRPLRPASLGSSDVKAMLKAELKRRGLTYADLVMRLAEHGVVETEANLRNKISRGTFTATFFMQCLIAAGCDHVQIGPLNRE